MSILSTIVDHAIAGEHAAAKQLISELPSEVRPIAQSISDTLAGKGLFNKIGLGARNPRPARPAPPRPGVTCGYGPNGRPNANRRPFQHLMLLSLAAGAAVTQTTTSSVNSLGEFVSPNSCGQITTANQFNNYFVSDEAWMTISVGGGAAPTEVLARMDGIEMVEFHAGQEVARYPLRTFVPQIERLVTDGTGSATSQLRLEGEGVEFPQSWIPQTNYSLQLQSQTPSWNTQSAIFILFGLIGSIGAPKNV